MNLLDATESFIALKQALGAVFASDARILRQFTRAIGGETPIDCIEPGDVQRFCRGDGPPTRWWERKHQALNRFFGYWVIRGELPCSPLQEAPPKYFRPFEPYIYTHDEIQRLLDATEILETRRTNIQPLTFRTLLITIYGTGLRASEALRLRLCDVDLSDGVLSIWDTKFFKSRLVPFGSKLKSILAAYLERRQHALPSPEGDRSAVFATQTGQAIRLGRLEAVFGRLRDFTGVKKPSSSPHQPRLHDLRHTFAVHRLVAWYRQGVDVQACLPKLATYLGHVNLTGTQAYLTMTPDLLTEASNRFERYAAVGTEKPWND